MGMKKWLEDLQKKVEEKKRLANDPDAQRAARKAEAKKAADRAIGAFKLAKKGADTYDAASKKADDVTSDVGDKVVEIAEKAKPLAEKVDNTVSAVGERVLGAFNAAKDIVAKKTEDLKKDKGERPSNGLGIIDILSPAVPEKDATKPKADKEEKPRPPQP